MYKYRWFRMLLGGCWLKYDNCSYYGFCRDSWEKVSSSEYSSFEAKLQNDVPTRVIDYEKYH